MKKTFRFLSMAALLVVGAIMTGCSNDDNIDTPPQPTKNNNIVTLTATVSLDGDAGTRAINATTGVKTFETGNQIAVIYKNTSSQTVKAVSTDFTPTGDNTKATFTVSLTNPATDSPIRYIYPATMAKNVATDATITNDDATIDYSGLLGSQNGTLATLGTNYDLAVKDGSLSGTDLPASVTLTNPLAICKFTLTDGTNPITSDVTSLTISDGTNAYAVTPSGLSEIYVAMKPASGKIAFTAATSTKTYFKTATGTSLVASKLYTNITVSMVELALGRVICDDGSVYASKSAAEGASKTPVVVITYLGSNGEAAPYNHGLALALSDQDSWPKNWDWAISSCSNKTPTVTGASSWMLPSKAQWEKMYLAGFLNTAGLKSGECYWSSTEDSATAWAIKVNTGGWEKRDKTNPLSNSYVRAGIAF